MAALSPEEKASRNRKRKLRREYKQKMRKTKSKLGLVAAPVMFLLAAACIVSIISDKIEYSEKEKELQVLIDRAAELEAENASYESILSEEDERTYMERIATEKLGYAYPDERRFYDTTRS